MTRRLVGGLLLAVAALGGCGSGGDASAEPGQELTVFAAASLSEVYEQLAVDFVEKHPGTEVSFSFAGSADLVAQVVAGAPADVLATADETTMARAVAAGAVEGDPEMVASNLLSLVTPPGNPAGVTGLDESLDGAAVVVCAPQVPCGAATAVLAERLGVSLSPVSEEGSVTDVLGKVTSGQADAGVVYATDAARAGDAVDVVVVPGAEDVVNRYPVAVTTDTDSSALAHAWVEHLDSPEGQEALRTAGFGAP